MISKDYIRHGQCKKCGRCCKYFVKILDEHPSNLPEAKKWPKDIKQFIINGKEVDVLVIEHHCHYLSNDGTCTIYMERFAVCHEFPNNPEDARYQNVKEFCGFTFEEAD